ncbi:MAG: hypothetical protein ACK4GT_12370 [Pararhodobacter sp.]
MLPTRQDIVKAVVAMAGLALMIAGFVMLLRSVWLAMVIVWGPTLTAAFMGGGLLFVGGLFVALALRRPRVVAAPPPPVSPLASVVTAFVQGFDAAQAMKKR